MIQIIHVSDTHAESETMWRIEALAYEHSDADALALTGDSTSKSTSKVPSYWNDFPQKLKLAVPGNHDDSVAYEHLDNWLHSTPWCTAYEDLLFVGIDWDSIDVLLHPDRFACPSSLSVSGLVLLIHEWNPSLRSLVQNMETDLFAREIPVLVLFGHNHPREFPGSQWETGSDAAGGNFYLSHVYSAKSGIRGIAHLVTWDSGRFSFELIQGAAQ